VGEIAQIDKIESRIFQIRGKKIILGMDLAMLYGVDTGALNQAVKRNAKRFPDDFMFYLSKEEISRISHIVISLKFHKKVSAFTEQGVAMLSSVLNSERAIQVNIAIMRAFTNLRRVALTYTGLKKKIDEMEKKYDAQFSVVFETIRQLIEPPSGPPKRKIGFHP
jgi:tetrahydromethanopterin S-methyltransferase subunit G